MKENLTELVSRLRATSSHKDKLKIIRENKSTLRYLLIYTYSPYLRYHIRQIPSDVQGLGTKSIGVDTFSLLNRIVLRELTGDMARLVLFNHIEKLTYNHAEILKLVVRKNLNIGVNVKLINKAYGNTLIREHKVMLAHQFDPNRMIYPALSTYKIDGVRATYKNGIFYTRNGHKVVGLEHLAGFLEFQSSGWNLDGELWIPNVRFDILSGIIRSLDTHKPTVKYAVFDTRHNYLVNQKERLDWLAKKLPLLRAGFAVERIPYKIVRNYEDLVQHYKTARRLGYEGTVVKTMRKPYEEKRSYSWMKLKPRHSKEYKIVGYFEGEGKYEGMLGGIVIQVGTEEVRVGSGFSDKERTEFWIDPTELLGRWATIESMAVTAAGKLRHPIYKIIRWDI